MLRATYAVQGMSCASCAQTVKNAIKDNAEKIAVDSMSGRTVALVPDKGAANTIEKLITESGFDAELLELLPVAAQELYTVKATIGGMTCAACANTIKSITDSLEFVENSKIDVLSGSAQFSITDESKEPILASSIDDAGYEYTLLSVDPDKNAQEHTKTRTVTIEIKGMHCQRCPDTVMRILRSYGDAVEIENPVSLDHPTVRFTYIPLPPKFGIRSIVDEIEAQTLGLKCKAVEPKTPEQVARENRLQEMADVTQRLKVALIFSLPALVIMLRPMYMMSQVGKVVMMIMATPVYFYSAAVFHKHALSTTSFSGVLHFGSMNLLMSLGTSISYWASLVLLIVDPGADVYFDSVIFLTLFLLMGRYLDLYSKAKTATAVSSVTALRPAKISVKENDEFLTVPAWKVDVGDCVKTVPGSRVGVDGVILNGSSQFDEATLTGESKPVPKAIGDTVYSGTVNSGHEAVVIRASAVDKGTLLDGIVDAVREGQMVRAKIERFSDSVTAVFVPIVIYLALVVWAAWFLAGVLGYVSKKELDKCHCNWFVFAMEFAVAVFVVACPCGVGLAAPTALYVGASVAAKHGIISRGGGEAFEEGSKVDIVCFDKTGTITTSKPIITDVYFPDMLVNVGDCDHDELVQLAARMEEDSSHPLALAVKNYAVANIKSSRVENIRAIPGRGVKANVCAGPLDGKEAVLGNEQLVWESKVQISGDEQVKLKEWKLQGKSVIILCVDLKVTMMMAATDEIRSEALLTITELQSRGIDCWMISGDNFETARAVAKQVGIPAMNVISQVLPEEKAEKIKWLQQTGLTTTRHDGRAIVAMVGDGVNDAPALARSDVGIAMGSGADITLNTAKFVLVHGDLSGVPLTLDLSSAVMRKVKLNYLWAGLYNMIAVPVAAGVAYPWTGYRLDPVFASLAMCMSSLSVMANSLLLRRYRKHSLVGEHQEASTRQ